MIKSRLYLMLLPWIFLACSGKTEETSNEGSGEESDVSTEEIAELLHQEVITADTVRIPAAGLFAALASFDNAEDVLPGVIASTTVSGQGVGSTRVLELADGSGNIDEEMIALDEEAMTMSYKIIDSPLPVENYIGTFRVTAIDETSSLLTWISEYDISPENEDWKNDLKGLHLLLFETLSKQTAGE